MADDQLPASALPSALPPALPDPYSPVARLLLLIGACTLGFFAGLVGALVLIGVIWHVPVTALSGILSAQVFHPQQRAIALFAQAMTHLAGFTFAPLILLAFTLPTRGFGLWARAQGKFPFVWLFAGIALTLVSLPLMSAAIEWNAGWHFSGPLADFDAWMREKEILAKRATELITQMNSPTDLVLCVLTLALVPALGEELVFRGIVQPTLTRGLGGHIHFGIWLTAILFSAIHMQFLGFVPRMLLGAGFGYLYAWSGRLAVPIAAHFTNNALQVVLLYLSQRGKLAGFDPDATTALPWPWVIASGALTAAVLLLLRRWWQPVPPAALQ
jgi:uncharacterized protein